MPQNPLRTSRRRGHRQRRCCPGPLEWRPESPLGADGDAPSDQGTARVYLMASAYFFLPEADFMIRAGFPATTAPGGTSLVTTLPAPTSACSPTVMPQSKVAPDPIGAPRLTKVRMHGQSVSVCNPPSAFVDRG